MGLCEWTWLGSYKRLNFKISLREYKEKFNDISETVSFKRMPSGVKFTENIF